MARMIVGKAGEPTCRHEFVTQDKEKFHVLRAVCVRCGATHIHTNAPEVLMSEASLKARHGGL